MKATLVVALSLVPALAVADFASIPIKPLKMSPVQKPEKVAELKADGTVVSEEGKVLIKIVKNEIQSPTGEWMMRLQPDGSVVARMKEIKKQDGKVVSEKSIEKTMGKLTDKDELITAEGKKIWLDEKGDLQSTDEKMSKAPQMLKWIGLNPGNRRAAMMLFLSMIGTGTMVSETSGPTGPGGKPAPPPATGTAPAPAKK